MTKDPHMHDLGNKAWLYLPENKAGFIQLGAQRVEFTPEQFARMKEIMKEAREHAT